jgi:hypothetical protein
MLSCHPFKCVVTFLFLLNVIDGFSIFPFYVLRTVPLLWLLISKCNFSAAEIFRLPTVLRDIRKIDKGLHVDIRIGKQTYGTRQFVIPRVILPNSCQFSLHCVCEDGRMSFCRQIYSYGCDKKLLILCSGNIRRIFISEKNSYKMFLQN